MKKYMTAQSREKKDQQAYYHVYNKGVEGRIIFKDEDDYKVFIGYLEDYVASPKDPNNLKKEFQINGRTFRGTPHQPKNYFQKVELVAYSLMPDHFHLLIHQVTSGAIEKFIRSLCTRYSMYFNKKYNRSGSLFEGPYKSIPINQEGRLLTYLSYHLHKTSKYSSYQEYLMKSSDSWVMPKVILDFFKNNIDDYKHFIESNDLGPDEKKLIESVSFPTDISCLESRDLTSSQAIYISSPKKSHAKVFVFFTSSLIVFFLLFGLGLRNIFLYEHYQIMPPFSQVLSEKTKLEPEFASETVKTDKEIRSEIKNTPRSESVTRVTDIKEPKPKSLVTVVLDDPSLTVNIREKPSTDSAKIGKASNSETFESVGNDGGWYEIKLTDGQVGFVSAEYIITNQKQQ